MFYKRMPDGLLWVWGSEAKARDFMPRFKCQSWSELVTYYRKQGLTL